MASESGGSAVSLLQEVLEARGRVVKGGSLMAMQPIYSALSELDRAGVKVSTSRRAEDVVGFNLGAKSGKEPLVLILWDRQAGEALKISVEPSAAFEGVYHCELDAAVESPGFLSLAIEKETRDMQTVNSAAEAVAWLMEKIAPCVVEMDGVTLVTPPEPSID